ncbi:MAG: hypothetical protein A2Y25_11350 [Candidatus Melainabacteria bacterium GWF2_37_15]|nr:MAG: hypothetical protein A2Y25_11350 [Candidatus Melainabacteria bacterium GWF2_37_15]
MSFLKYLFGIQLFLGSLWCFYYSLNFIGDVLLGLSALIFIPLIYSLLTKKFREIKAACVIILALCFVMAGLIVHSLWATNNKKAPVAINKNNTDPVIKFEQKLLKATDACLDSYDNAFSKTIENPEEQCSLINKAQNHCNSAIQDIDKIIIPKDLSKDVTNLLQEAKTDAKNSVQNWSNFYKLYSKQCSSKNYVMNPIEAKLQFISAIKNVFMTDLKIKKAKSLN